MSDLKDRIIKIHLNSIIKLVKSMASSHSPIVTVREHSHLAKKTADTIIRKIHVMVQTMENKQIYFRNS